MNEEQLKEALSVSDEHPVIRAFLQIIAEQDEVETLAGLMPNLSAEDRAYNCGRAAAIKDLSSSIKLLRSASQLTSGQP